MSMFLQASLQRLMNILQSVDKMEKLLGIQANTPGQSVGGLEYTRYYRIY